MTGQRRAWSGGRHVSCSLVSGEQVLDVPLGHHRRFARACTGIESDVPVQVQAQPLAVVEANHQKSPPLYSETSHE